MNDRARFGKFTEHARHVLSYAQEEAQSFQHNYIGTEHLLLALIHEHDSIAAKVLTNLGIELDDVRAKVNAIIGRGDHIILGEIGFTPQAKKVIELAVDEARRLQHNYIGTEHLLLALIREGYGIAAGILESLHVNLADVRTTTIQVLQTNGEEPLPSHNKEKPQHIINDQDHFDKFTERSRKVLSHAHEEALRLQHNYIGTEHLLLGLVREGEGVAAKVLANLGVELNRVRTTVEFIIGRGDRTVLGQIGLTPRAKKVIELSADEARRLKHHYIGTEHLLLGMVREGEGIAAGVLASLGINLENIRTTVLHVLSTRGENIQYNSPLSNLPFSPSTRRVLTFAQGEALLMLHDQISTYHILLGLLREPGLASITLTDAGITLDRVHDEIIRTIGQGNNTTPNPITPDSETDYLLTTTTLSIQQIQRSQPQKAQIEPAHILLTLLAEPAKKPFIAYTILASLGVDLPTLHTTLLKALADQL